MTATALNSAWRAVSAGGRGYGGDASATGGSVDLRALRYLIVDDSRFYRTVIKNALAAIRMTNVIEAVDSEDALQVLRAGPIDFVLVDYEMPAPNGVELVRTVRWSEETEINPRIPIIMISQFAEQSVVVEARNAGVHEFLTKPVSPQVLYDRIRATILHPREFIDTKSYRGPDRRWMKRD